MMHWVGVVSIRTEVSCARFVRHDDRRLLASVAGVADRLFGGGADRELVVSAHKRPRGSGGPKPGQAPSRSRARVVVAAGASAAVLAGVIVLAVIAGHGSSEKYNTKPQAFVLPHLDSPGAVALSSYSGRPVVVNFFASWCTVCASELPVFDHEAKTLAGRVAVIEVNALETGDARAFARRFALASSVTAVARDVGGDQGNGLYKALGGSGSMPITAFYSPTGRLLTTHIGGFDSATLPAELRQLYGPRVSG